MNMEHDLFDAESGQRLGVIRDRGLRLETAVIVAIAERLSARLKRDDPVAGRVELGNVENALCAIRGVWRGLTASR